jgi:hypothetical protein
LQGAAFGFSVVLDQAKEQLEPHLGSLVPKLFRYRYDPDQKVQSSMRAIWQALAGSRRGVVRSAKKLFFHQLRMLFRSMSSPTRFSPSLCPV